MSRKRIRVALEHALLQDGPMYESLYTHELEELQAELFESLKRDHDAFLFAVTENNGHVAMLLIEPSGTIYRNEEARTRLQAHWPQTYAYNMRQLLPTFTKQLLQNEIPINGVKYVA